MKYVVKCAVFCSGEEGGEECFGRSNDFLLEVGIGRIHGLEVDEESLCACVLGRADEVGDGGDRARGTDGEEEVAVA